MLTLVLYPENLEMKSLLHVMSGIERMMTQGGSPKPSTIALNWGHGSHNTNVLVSVKPRGAKFNN